jgi:ketosteroid isomerase-like protein
MFIAKTPSLAAVVTLICAGGLLLCAVVARAQAPGLCGAGTGAASSTGGFAGAGTDTGTGNHLKDMLDTEYAFEQKAQDSVREAFLAYLADDSLVLEPGPTPGRAFYQAAKPSTAKLQWYPSIAAVAGGGDLGFSTGPWMYTDAGGSHYYGDFVTVWKRDASCRWRVQFDGGVSHAMPENAEPKLDPDQAPVGVQSPPQKYIAQDALGKAMRDFEHTTQQDGLAAALRTYARDGDFRFYVEGEAPKSAGAASRFLAGGAPVESWSEEAHGRSADSTLAYSVGRSSDTKRGGRHAYLQIWQYDPKVANWGLRILLITPLEGAK